ncbi:MAG: D-alanyl-D-alanine carboxypeptidase [Alphaproteobacteria bacterium]|nr:D-alanyl-D-alanine carboxypeptidase [Alphaproteobacteria bacterium]
MRRIVGALAAFAVGLVMIAGAAQAASKYAALVIDADTDTVLFSRNGDARRHPASLTKIMTLYMLFEALESGHIKPGQHLTVSKRAAGQPPSKLGLKRGQTIKVEDAIRALVTKSANDVATAISEALGGTEYRFALKMTDKARALGMRKTTFRNASGLHHRRQVTTARDMATLAIAIQRDFPQYYHYFSTRSFTWKGRTYTNHNKLLGRYRGTDGIKTGYIRASGFNLVASVERNGHRLIGVVFGGKKGVTRDRQMRNILDRGFKQVAEIRVASATPPLPVPRPQDQDTATDKPAALLVATAVAHVLPAPPLPTPAPEMEAGSRDGGDDDWGVQVGAYSTEVRAQRAIAVARGQVTGLLNSADAKVETLNRRDGPIFRARLVGLMETEARAACLALKRRHLPCVPVPAKAMLDASSTAEPAG